MDKKLILAVAGSGKTRTIIESLSPSKRSLIITYTDANYRNICSRISNEPPEIRDNVEVFTYFRFLYGFCFRPFHSPKFKEKGIDYKTIPSQWLKKNAENFGFYMQNRYLFHNRISRYIIETDSSALVQKRLETYFDQLLVDEVQDLAGNDFNLLVKLMNAEIDILMVGDFFQHTYDTSRDGNIQKNLHQKGQDHYLAQFPNSIAIDDQSLSASHRCPPSICSFVTENLGVDISSARKDASDKTFTLIDDESQANNLIKDDTIVKLFYNNSHKYYCYSMNWGKSKGLDDFEDVCVVLNIETEKLVRGAVQRMNSDQTRNKFYVACTRAKGNLYFLPNKFVKPYLKN